MRSEIKKYYNDWIKAQRPKNFDTSLSRLPDPNKLNKYEDDSPAMRLSVLRRVVTEVVNGSISTDDKILMRHVPLEKQDLEEMELGSFRRTNDYMTFDGSRLKSGSEWKSLVGSVGTFRVYELEPEVEVEGMNMLLVEEVDQDLEEDPYELSNLEYDLVLVTDDEFQELKDLTVGLNKLF